MYFDWWSRKLSSNLKWKRRISWLQWAVFTAFTCKRHQPVEQLQLLIDGTHSRVSGRRSGRPHEAKLSHLLFDDTFNRVPGSRPVTTKQRDYNYLLIDVDTGPWHQIRPQEVEKNIMVQDHLFLWGAPIIASPLRNHKHLWFNMHHRVSSSRDLLRP